MRDLRSAVQWYARLLDFEPAEGSHGGTIFDIPTEGETRLALDANRPDFTADGPPRFFFWTDDIEATAAFLADIGAETTSDIVDIGSVAFLQFADPDGNPLMVCQSRAGTP